MKYIYLSHLRYPSEITHSTFAVKTCEEFRRVGLDIELWIPKRVNPKFRHLNIKDYFSVRYPFVVKELVVIDLTATFRGKWPFFLMLFSFNISVVVHGILRGIIKNSVFYLHDIRDAFFISFLRPTMILEVHDFYESRIEFLNKVIFSKIKGFIVTNSIKVKFLQQKYNIPTTNILHQPNAVDFEKFQISESRDTSRSTLKLPLDKKIVLYTGNLFGWKGATILLEAASFLPTTIHVYFVGGTDRDLKEFSEKKINNVKIVGRKPHNEIPEWLHAADVLVLPNSGKDQASKFETSPVKLFEYMASSRAIVASDLPSVRDVVDENLVWFFEPDNSKDLARVIMEVLEKPDNSKIKKSLRKAAENTWFQRTDNIINFIRLLNLKF